METPETGFTAKPRIVHIEPDRAGQRIDNFLIGSLKGVPKSRIYRMLRKGEVRVNKGRVKADYRLQAGDAVRIPPLRQAETAQGPQPGNRVLERVNGSILLENKEFIVLNKPAGMAVHGGSGLNYGIIEALRKCRPEAPFLELGHRLDRETSGCLLIAKKRSFLRQFHRLLRDEAGEMEKSYLALVKGQWPGGQRAVDAPLRKNTLRSGERVVRVDPEGKPSLSVFRPRQSFSSSSLMEISLHTGRTHQIRVHAAYLGFPIAGDEKYGDPDYNRQLRQLGLRRLFLHASLLAFTLPDNGERHEISAPLPRDLQEVLKRLQQQGLAGQDAGC